MIPSANSDITQSNRPTIPWFLFFQDLFDKVNRGFHYSTSNTLVKSGVAFVDAGTATVTLTLPSPVAGDTYTIKKIDSSANPVNVIGTIDGNSGYALASQYDCVQLTSDGNQYYIIGTY